MKKKLPRRPRSYETIFAILKCKAGPMRDRRQRRPKDQRRIRQQQE